MAGRPVVQALHGDDDGGGLALGPEPADVVAGHGRGSMASRRPRCITSVNDRDTSNPDTCWPRTGFKRVRLVFR